MEFLTIIAAIISIYSIGKMLVKRSKAEKKYINSIKLKVKSYRAMENLYFTIVLSFVVTFLLFDTNSKTISIFSIILIALILILGISKYILQIRNEALVVEEGILFYNGDFINWNDILEFKIEKTNKVGNSIILIGGTSKNTISVLRERLEVTEDIKDNFERYILEKLKDKNEVF